MFELVRLLGFGGLGNGAVASQVRDTSGNIRMRCYLIVLGAWRGAWAQRPISWKRAGMSQVAEQLLPLYHRLPHGPNGMGRDAVARNQRSRLYGGMIESVAQRGYQGTTVAHAIALAGVSRRAFYELFPNKEQCFLGAHDIVVAPGAKADAGGMGGRARMGEPDARRLQGAAG